MIPFSVIECDALPTSLENGKILAPNGTFYGAKAEVLCNKGYQIEGPRTILCSIEGQWSEQLAKCVPG